MNLDDHPAPSTADAFSALHAQDCQREASLARATSWLSPELLGLARADRAIHLGGAPGKRVDGRDPLGEVPGRYVLER